jgi:hypothetical protein
VEPTSSTTLGSDVSGSGSSDTNKNTFLIIGAAAVILAFVMMK